MVFNYLNNLESKVNEMVADRLKTVLDELKKLCHVKDKQFMIHKLQ